MKKSNYNLSVVGTKRDRMRSEQGLNKELKNESSGKEKGTIYEGNTTSRKNTRIYTSRLEISNVPFEITM